MSKATVQLNYAEVGRLLKSQEVMNVLDAQADGIIARGRGVYEKSPYVGKNRCNVAIVTSDEATYYKNLQDNRLLKALRGGSK